MSAREVAALLRIKPQTLYAYVSRGLIRKAAAAPGRGQLYLREDVERIRAKGQARAEGAQIFKGGSPRWSEPIVQTAITQIGERGPSYRGRSAVTLAESGARFENVAELIWSGIWREEAILWARAPLPRPVARILAVSRTDACDPIATLALATMALATRGEASEDLHEGTTVLSARRLMRSLAELPGVGDGRLPAGTREDRGDRSIAQTIATRLAVADPEAVRLINGALVLLADHDLTPQTFSARLAASNGANLYFCIASALSVHSSSRARRACDAAEDLLGTAKDQATYLSRLQQLRRDGGRIPGFDHPLYPGGDPRAGLLMRCARQHAQSRRAKGRDALKRLEWIEKAADALSIRPGVEAGMAALVIAVGLPRRAGGQLFALARCAGWIGHVIEQRMAGQMLRPVARYR